MKAVIYNQRVERGYSKLSSDQRAEMTRILKLMEQRKTWQLGLPHVRSLSGTGLYEIRLHDAQGIARALFVAIDREKLLILNVFKKKTQATPRKEIDLALKRLKEFSHD